MPSRQRLCITVDLENGADPLRGSLQTPDGQPRSFWGWLQLIQVIEDAIAAATQTAIAQRSATGQDTHANPPSTEDTHEDHDPQINRDRDC